MPQSQSMNSFSILTNERQTRNNLCYLHDLIAMLKASKKTVNFRLPSALFFLKLTFFLYFYKKKIKTKKTVNKAQSMNWFINVLKRVIYSEFHQTSRITATAAVSDH